jgi:Signal transduction histidine kinase
MRTQQYIQVEAIVAKYKNLASESEAVKKTMDSFTEFHIPNDVARLDFVEQLLIRIYKLRAGENADPVVIKQYSDASSFYIEGILSSTEEDFLVNNFSDFVNYAFSHSNVVRTFFGGICDSPSEWSNLVPYLLNIKGGRIFIPCSDNGQEFVGLTNCEVTVRSGYKNAAIQALAQGTTISQYSACDKEEGLCIDLEDGIFDAVIVDMHCNEFLQDKNAAEKSLNDCFRIVRNGGEILLCLSKKAMMGEATETLRAMLKREQMLQDVILLPSGNILLHIEKKPHDSFVMCDATNLSKRSNERILDVEAFQKEVEMAGMPERDDHPRIQRYGYDMLDSNMMLPTFYLHFPKGGTPIAELASLESDLILSDECSPEERVITVNQLSTVFAKGEFKVADLPTLRQDRLRRYYHVHGPAVIMAVSERNLAVGYTLEPLDFLVPKNLYVLNPVNNVDVRYLASKLLCASVKEQILELVCGKGFNASLVANWPDYIRMDLLPLEEQQSFVQNVILKDYALQENESAKQEQGFKHAIRLRKHALIQNISAFDSLFHSLEYCLSEHNGMIKAGDQLSSVSSMTVGEAMELLHTQLETISYRVEHLTESNDWGKSESIEPQSFIENYEKLHASAEFQFCHLWEPFETNTFSKDVFDKKTGKLLFHKGESMNMAWFPRKALQQVFDNIVANAREHGFKDKSRKDYVIQTSWNTDGMNMLIEIANNGEPLPKDVDTDLLLEYGYSTALNKNGHSGIGGGEIAEVVRKFGGDIKIVSSPEKKFTVSYILTIPLASIY